MCAKSFSAEEVTISTAQTTREQLEKLNADSMGRTARLSFSRVVSEAGSEAGALGAILIAKKILPDQTQSLKNMVAESIVSPRLKEFDGFLDKFPSIEPGGKDSKRHQLGDNERAHYIADLLVDFSILVAAGTVAQTAVQGAVNHKLGLPKLSFSKQLGAVMVDKGAQVAAFGVGNTVLAEQNMAAQQQISSALQEEGKPKDKADAIGSLVTNYLLPNLVGMAGGIVMQDRMYKKEFQRLLADPALGRSAH